MVVILVGGTEQCNNVPWGATTTRCNDGGTVMMEKSKPKVKKEEYDVVLQGQPAVKPMVVSQREGEAFRVWSPDEFSRLKRVLIGRPEGTNMPAPEPAWRYDVPGCKLPSHMPFPQEMVDAANEQMDYFVGMLENRGILVDRIPILPMMMNRPFNSPIGWGQLEHARGQQCA